MKLFAQIQQQLREHPKKWLVTGCAGFIGSNLLEALLKLDQTVIGLDNFVTGYQRNLDEVQSLVTPQQWARFHFTQGDICDFGVCQRIVQGVDYVLHQAALGSVPRSLQDPIATNNVNITGFLNVLVAAKDARVKSFVYAASSSTYGDHPDLPKVEGKIGKPLSPYAVTKYVNELYAEVFARSYGINVIGLRYFNVFGQRQDPQGAYAAVIPKWISGMIKGESVFINGDGETSRDFCFVANAVQANILAATNQNSAAMTQVYNIAIGDQTTLNQLFSLLRSNLAQHIHGVEKLNPTYRDFRAGDVRHSLADITKAKTLLGYQPTHRIGDGISEAMGWYCQASGDRMTEKKQLLSPCGGCD